ncbi:MAG: putative metalloprotease CJM1_0395 family protein [Phycisphaerales bacterium]
MGSTIELDGQCSGPIRLNPPRRSADAPVMDLGAITSNQIIGSLLSPRTFGAVPAIDRLGPASSEDALDSRTGSAEGPDTVGRTRRPDRFERSAPPGFAPAPPGPASVAGSTAGTGSAPADQLAPGGDPGVESTREKAGGTAGAVDPKKTDGAGRADAALQDDADAASGDDAPLEGGPVGADGEPLDSSEKKQVEELKARDREVRTHEQAHKAAGGQYAGAISYSYQTGPDGQRYAVGGSVSIDAGPVPGDPEATIAKMQVVRRAALAPAEPSSQDQRVASQASRTEAEARAELARPSEDGQEPSASSSPDDRNASGSIDRDADAASDRLDPGAPSRPAAAPAFAERQGRAAYTTSN